MINSGLWMAPIIPLAVGGEEHRGRKPIKKAPRHHHVLKLNGKNVSDPKLQLRVFAWIADDLTRQGQGGGVVGVLLPKSEKQWSRLTSDRKKYTLQLVRRRDGGRRGVLKNQAMSAELLVRLIALCPAQPNWKKRHFTEWLLRELKSEGSKVRSVIAELGPDLLVQMRAFGWWYRLLGAKKMSR